MRVELAHALVALRGRRFDAELARDHRAQPVRIDTAQRHQQRHLEGLGIELLGQRARHRRGAAADRADQHAQLLALLDAAAQAPARGHVRASAEPELELRLVAEGVAFETEAFQMLHGLHPRQEKKTRRTRSFACAAAPRAPPASLRHGTGSGSTTGSGSGSASTASATTGASTSASATGASASATASDAVVVRLGVVVALELVEALVGLRHGLGLRGRLVGGLRDQVVEGFVCLRLARIGCGRCGRRFAAQRFEALGGILEAGVERDDALEHVDCARTIAGRLVDATEVVAERGLATVGQLGRSERLLEMPHGIGRATGVERAQAHHVERIETPRTRSERVAELADRVLEEAHFAVRDAEIEVRLDVALVERARDAALELAEQRGEALVVRRSAARRGRSGLLAERLRELGGEIEGRRRGVFLGAELRRREFQLRNVAGRGRRFGRRDRLHHDRRRGRRRFHHGRRDRHDGCGDGGLGHRGRDDLGDGGRIDTVRGHVVGDRDGRRGGVGVSSACQPAFGPNSRAVRSRSSGGSTAIASGSGIAAGSTSAASETSPDGS